MATLTDNPSKAEELAYWRAFLSSLPRCSYLASYLAGSEELLKGYMADDMSCELIPLLRRQRDDARQEVKEATEAAKKAQEQLSIVQNSFMQAKSAQTRLRDQLKEASKLLSDLSERTQRTKDAIQRQCEA